jgi:hypothetical protein
VHAPTDDKDGVKDSYYKEPEHIFDQFPRYHMKILMRDFNAKVGRVDIFKPIKLAMKVYMKPIMTTGSEL